MQTAATTRRMPWLPTWSGARACRPRSAPRPGATDWRVRAATCPPSPRGRRLRHRGCRTAPCSISARPVSTKRLATTRWCSCASMRRCATILAWTVYSHTSRTACVQWCKHCKSLLPEFEKAASTLAAQHAGKGTVALAKIDATVVSLQQPRPPSTVANHPPPPPRFGRSKGRPPERALWATRRWCCSTTPSRLSTTLGGERRGCSCSTWRATAVNICDH